MTMQRGLQDQGVFAPYLDNALIEIIRIYINLPIICSGYNKFIFMVKFTIINCWGTALGYNGMTEDRLHPAEHLPVVVQDFVSNLLLFRFRLIIRELFNERASIFEILNIRQTRRIL